MKCAGENNFEGAGGGIESSIVPWLQGKRKASPGTQRQKGRIIQWWARATTTATATAREKKKGG